ncbi:MAG: TolC family protein [Cocleimonas sp.]
MKSIYTSGLTAIISMTMVGCTNVSSKITTPVPKVAPPIANTITGQKKTPVKKIKLVAWEQFFTDPTAKKVISTALKNNRDLRIAATNVAEAQGLYQIRRRDQIPNVSVNGSRSQTRNSLNLSGNKNTINSYGVNVGLVSYEIDFWGRVANLKDAALANYFATLEAQRTSQLSVISETANAYYNWLATRENLRLANATLKARAQSLRLITLRQTVGIASELDHAQAEVAKATVEAQKAQIQRALTGYQAVLELLVGSPIDKVLASAKHAGRPKFDFVVPENLNSSVLLNRPDIISAEEGLRAANANINAARAAFLPSISLVGSGGFASGDLGDLFKASSKTWSFTPSISLPIFGNSIQANLDVAKARQNRSVAEYEKAIQAAFSEVYTQFQARKARRSEIIANNKLVWAQKKRQNLAQVRYDAGLASYIEVLDSQQNSFASEQSLLESERGEVESIILLYKALGGGDAVTGSFRSKTQNRPSKPSTISIQ